MVLDWMNLYTEALRAQPQWLLALIFVVAFIEAFAIVGVVVPGVVIFFALSMAIGLEPYLFFSAWAVASLGAFAGDGVSFWLGRRWQPKSHGELVAQAKRLLQNHGGKGIFIGRFIGPVRPVMPLVGGMLGMKRSIFLAYAVPACVLWAPVYLLPGMVFGASLELAAAMAGRLAVLLLVLVLGVWLSLWLVRVIYTVAAQRSSWWLKRLIQWSYRHRWVGRWVRDVLRPGSREVMAIAFLGLILAASLTALIILLLIAPAWLPQWSGGFHPATWASSLRNEWTDGPMVMISLIVDAPVVMALATLSVVAMALAKRYQAAGHMLVAMLGIGALALAINALMDLVIARPARETLAFASLVEVPHIGFAWLATVFCFFALVVAKDLNARRRKWPYLFCTVVLVLGGFSLFYLELASLMGLASALALAIGWVSLVGMGYRHRSEVRPFPVGLVLVFLLAWAVLSWHRIDQGHATRLADSQVPIASTTMDYRTWQQQGWRDLPAARSVLGPELERTFDVQLAGELAAIEQAFIATGYGPMPELNWRRVIEGFGRNPMPWPRAFNGRSEALWLMKTDGNGSISHVLRLWETGVSVKLDNSDDGLKPVWVGQLRQVSLDRNWLGLAQWVDTPAPDQLDALVYPDGLIIRTQRLSSAPTH